LSYAQVAILQQNRNADGLYTYEIRGDHQKGAMVGSRVVVPFGGGDRFLLGVVTAVFDVLDVSVTYKIKSILEFLPQEYALTENQVALAFFLRESCLSSFAEAFQCVSPSGLEITTKQTYWLTSGNEDYAIAGGKFEGNQLQNPKAISSMLLAKAIKAKKIVKVTSYTPSFSEKTQIFVHIKEGPLEALIGALPKQIAKQIEILTYLSDKSPLSLSQIRTALNTQTSTIERLRVLGLVYFEEVVENRDPVIFRSERPRGHIELTEPQHLIYQALEKAYGENHVDTPFLLKGVTGSGKTEIYIELAKRVISDEKQVLVLVPEIALTPQLTDKFNRAFSGQVAILHSQIPSKERMDQWIRIRKGELKVIIGARSAIFAPFDSLGLIIMDEEHDDSYKSDLSPRYDSRDVAKWLSERHHVLLLLASGTPSIESLYHAKEGNYRYLELNKRYNNFQLPVVELVDMKNEIHSGHQSFLSRRLIKGLHEMKTRGEQGILFLNRKGHSTQLICKSCGERVKCPNCDISLTYYKKTDASHCHYCGYIKKNLGTCDHCKGQAFDYLGIGVEKVEEELQKQLPGLRIQKVDSSVTGRRGALEQIYHDFEAHDFDLLLGTQIISKGIDFHRVSLIGILGVDALLSLPDYRANERAFNLLTQLAGRGGRADLASKVYIQTFSPEHPILRSVVDYDHSSYMTDEMLLRYLFKYPPYMEMAHIVLSAEDPRVVEEGASKLYQKLKKSYEKYRIQVELSGPNPALYAKIKNRYRMQIIIKFQVEEKERVKRVLSYYLIEEYERLFDSNMRVQLDLKPLSLM
jgi:primosomal protein N' (replication factor Y)